MTSTDRRWYGFERSSQHSSGCTVETWKGSGVYRKAGKLFWFASEAQREQWAATKVRGSRAIVPTRTMPGGWISTDAEKW